MSLSTLEVGLQTTASVVSKYLKEKKGVPVIPKDGLNRLVKEEFPHFEKKEVSPGVYQIRIPMEEAYPRVSDDKFLTQEVLEENNSRVLWTGLEQDNTILITIGSEQIRIPEDGAVNLEQFRMLINILVRQ